MVGYPGMRLSGWRGWRWSGVDADAFRARLSAHRPRVHLGVVGRIRDWRRVYRALDRIRPARVFHAAPGVTGGDYTAIRGAPRWADAWALSRAGVVLRRYPGTDPEAILDAEAAHGPITAILAFQGVGALGRAARARGVGVYAV